MHHLLILASEPLLITQDFYSLDLLQSLTMQATYSLTYDLIDHFWRTYYTVLSGPGFTGEEAVLLKFKELHPHLSSAYNFKSSFIRFSLELGIGLKRWNPNHRGTFFYFNVKPICHLQKTRT